MPVPDFQSLMLPVLMALAEGSPTTLANVRDRVAASEGLTPEDLRERLPSGRQSVLANRVSWAAIHMARAGIVERTGRGVYRLTRSGEDLLSETPSRVDMNVLRKHPSYSDWLGRARTPSADNEAAPVQTGDLNETPEETLNRAARELRTILEAEVLQRVRDAAPAFLERVVVDLLIAMGYGDGDPTMGRVTGRSGDGGIDGTIREDALGLDEVYVQSKRYADGHAVGEGDLRNFAGAIDAAGTTKGVFVTTADFTRAAKNYVARSPKRIVLIDGAELARLMVRHEVGVRTRETHEIKRIDEDYFDQEAL